MSTQYLKLTAILSILITAIFLPVTVNAHCDSMDGPVVMDAKEALQTGNIDLVLIWITDDQEEELRESFRETINIRGTNEDVRNMADRYFFETLVRLHREAEGAPYTGLKPSGTDFGPAIPLSEKALDDGSLKEVRDLLLRHIEQGLHHYYDKASELKDFDPADIEAGREYVDAYVKYMHYVEPLYRAAISDVSHGVGGHSH